MWLLTFLSIFLGVSGQIVIQPGDKCSRHYVCPPEYLRLSQNCFYFSKNKTTWQDAFFACEDLHGKIAIIRNANQDQMLRSFLNKISIVNEDRWIGGLYDWEQMLWKWGASGKEIKYKGFVRANPDDKDQLKWTCVVLDPNLEYRWNWRSCLEEKYFICQTRLKKANNKENNGRPPKYWNNIIDSNEIPLPPLPYRQRNSTNLKEYELNKLFDPGNSSIIHNSYAYRNHTVIDKRKEKRRNKKNRRNRKKCGKHIVRNGTEYESPQLKYGKRRRRNKSKEDGSLENLHTKVYYSTTGNNPLHPVLITEEVSFS